MALENERVRLIPEEFKFSFIVDETFTLDVIEDTSDDDPNFDLDNSNATESEGPAATRAQEDGSEDASQKDVTISKPLENGRIQRLDDEDTDSELVIDLEPQEENNTDPCHRNSETTVSNKITNSSDLHNDKGTEPLLVDSNIPSSSKNTKNDTTNYQCSSCPYKAKSLSRLKKHSKQHKDATFSCPRCPFTTDTNPKLCYHQLHCKENTDKYKCPHCHTLTTRMTSLKKHIRIYHSENPVFTCPKCPFSTSRWSLVEKHKQKHEGKSFKCGLCSFEASERVHLKKHHIMKHSLKCSSCAFKTSCPDVLEKHQQCHVIKNVELIKCKMCHFADSVPEVVKLHEKRHLKMAQNSAKQS